MYKDKINLWSDWRGAQDRNLFPL